MLTMLMLTALAQASAAEIFAGPLETVAEGFQFTEGPLWFGEEGLIFSDIPADTIFRADKSVFRRPSRNSNGLLADLDGRLIACEHGSRQVTRTEADGAPTVIAERFLDRRLNSPNDAVIRSDGRIFFSDPPYGLDAAKRELPFSGVYTLSPDGKLDLVLAYFAFPNGLALSPDEKTLYIGDAEANAIVAVNVAPDGTLSRLRPFADVPRPDGMKTDAAGNLYTSCEAGIRVYDPAGKLLAAVNTPQAASNCAFGGDDGKTLYVTARSGVYKVRTTSPGFRPGGK